MKRFPVALQLYSVRNEIKEDLRGTLEKVKEMGYEGVELCGRQTLPAAEIKQMCAEIGLVPISAHVTYQFMVDDPDLIAFYKDIGCEYVVIPHLHIDDMVGKPEYDEAIANIKKFGQIAIENGMKLCYHNHDFEFKKFDGEYILDKLYRDVPKELLDTQLDTCWVKVGGADPAEYIRKYADRCNIVHLKDFVGSKSANMYGLIGTAQEEVKRSSTFDYRPVGCGVQDFHEILKACHEVGVKWVVVEQDNPSMGKTPLECAKVSCDYLKEIN